MMKEKNNIHFTGKTKKEIVSIMECDQFNDPHASVWVFFLEKKQFGRKKYLYLFFEKNIVVKFKFKTKNFWQ